VADVPVEERSTWCSTRTPSPAILAANMVMIYPNNANSKKEYEQQMCARFT